MSNVRKKDQKPQKFSTLDAILDMYDHTVTVTRNRKLFTEDFADLTNRIESEARMVYHCCRVANEDLDNRIKEEAEQRLRLQVEALKTCGDLKTDIMLAKTVFHLRTRKVTAWTKYVNDVMKQIKSWNISEERTYKNNFGS